MRCFWFASLLGLAVTCGGTARGWADEAANLSAAESVAASVGGDAGGACCDGGCDSCCDDGCGGCRILGFIAESDHCFDDFISPMTNPIYFEDPRTLTEARVIFLDHNIPNRAPLAGGDVQVLACQLRAALNDRWSVIAAKDGFVFAGSDAPFDDGWADVSVGLKCNLFVDTEGQRIVSAGAAYELPIGSRRTLQGNGDGEFHLFATGGTQIGDLGHLVSAAGLRLPADDTVENQVAYWSVHLDRRLAERPIYGLIEFNWYHWLQSAQGPFANVTGLDLFNAGATDVAGTDIVTGAFGLKYKPCGRREYGVAWEVPLTDRRDVLDNRLTVDAIFRY